MGITSNSTATGGIGTISSRLTLEGPLFSDKVSFLVSARRTYADIFLAFAKDSAVRDNSLYFYDLNGKLNYTINEKNRIFLSGYFGKDVFANDFAGMYFGNRTFTFRWNHLFSKKLFSNFTFLNSHYFYDLGTPENSQPYFNWLSFLDDYGGKADFIWYPMPEHTFKYGISSTYHVIKPGAVSFDDEGGGTTTSELSPNQALESAIYFSGESKLGEKLSIRYGLRYSLFKMWVRQPYTATMICSWRLIPPFTRRAIFLTAIMELNPEWRRIIYWVNEAH